MKKPKKDKLLSSAQAARRRMVQAEDELANLLRDLQKSAKGEKTAFGAALEKAWKRVRDARKYLDAANDPTQPKEE